MRSSELGALTWGDLHLDAVTPFVKVRASTTKNGKSADLRLHPARLAYYKTAIVEQLSSNLPRAAVWPMLHTWSLAAENGSFNEQETES